MRDWSEGKALERGGDGSSPHPAKRTQRGGEPLCTPFPGSPSSLRGASRCPNPRTIGRAALVYRFDGSAHLRCERPVRPIGGKVNFLSFSALKSISSWLIVREPRAVATANGTQSLALRCFIVNHYATELGSARRGRIFRSLSRTEVLEDGRSAHTKFQHYRSYRPRENDTFGSFVAPDWNDLDAGDGRSVARFDGP